MLHSLQILLQTSVMERLTLLANHVVSGEPVARDRLVAHAGRTFSLALDGWPSLLPAPPSMSFLVTPAGLLEWSGPGGISLPDLRLTLDASNPARVFGELLRGQRPDVGIEGDAALASDLSWLLENLRWDVTDDLARIVGPGPAHELARVFRSLSIGVRQAVAGLRSVAGKLASAAPSVRRPGASGASSSAGDDSSRAGSWGEAGRPVR